jgi:hypothetical protein
MRGGPREGAGRKPGSLKKTPFSDRTEQLGKRLTKEEKTELEAHLKQLRGECKMTKMYEKVTVNIDWSSMIEGSSSEDIATVDKDATLVRYEELAEQRLRKYHDRIGEKTEIAFTYNNPRYSHETDDGLDEEVQEILENLWDAQLFWVYK